MRERFERIVRLEQAIWLLRYGRLMAWLWKRFMRAGAWCYRESLRIADSLDENGLVKAEMKTEE